MNSKRFVVLLLAVAFALTITVSLASANYFVIKDENGVCKVIQANEKTPKTIAGPFKTKEEAEKAKEQLCATGGTTRERTRDHVDRPTEKAKDQGGEAKDKLK